MLDFKAAIFDLDGTIIDSMSIWEKTALEWANKNRVTFTQELFDAAKYGKLSDVRDYMVKTFPSLNIKKAESDIKIKMILRYLFSLRLKEGVRDYLAFLKKQNIKIALATSSPESVCRFVLRRHRLKKYFDAILYTDSFTRGKEFPDIFTEAAKRLDTPPADCMVYEDSYKALEGVRTASMRFCAVYDSHSRYNKFLKENADIFIYSFYELMP